MKTYPKTKEKSSLPKGRPKKSEPAPATSFHERVYELARQVPKGRVTTYGAIAEASGLRLTPRMVGWAMNAAGKAQPPVPAHRVVNSSGMLSGRQHFATPTLMQELLEQEGVAVKNDKIVHFKEVLWLPPVKKTKLPGAKKKP